MNKYIEYAIKYGVYAWGKTKFYGEHISAEKKILAVCFCPIGDTLVALPFFRELKKNYPKHKMTIIASVQNSNLFEACSFVDKLLIYDDKAHKHHFLTNLQRTYCFAKKHLVHEHYEIAFSIEYRMPRIFAAWLIYFSGAKRRICFSEQAYKQEHDFYMGSYDQYFTDIFYDTSLVHDVQKNLDLLKYIGCDIENDSMEVSLTDQDRLKADQFLSDKRFSADNKNMVVVLSTSVGNRDWPVENYIEVCKRLRADGRNLNYILLGAGETAEKYAECFCQEIPGTVDLIGRTTLRESMAVMQKCHYYLGGDTGPMHMAYACGLKGVAIYKYPKNLPVGVYDATKTLYPWRSDMQIVQPDEYLPGCEEGCYGDEAHCIKQITEDEVIAKLKAEL